MVRQNLRPISPKNLKVMGFSADKLVIAKPTYYERIKYKLRFSFVPTRPERLPTGRSGFQGPSNCPSIGQFEQCSTGLRLFAERHAEFFPGNATGQHHLQPDQFDQQRLSGASKCLAIGRSLRRTERLRHIETGLAGCWRDARRPPSSSPPQDWGDHWQHHYGLQFHLGQPGDCLERQLAAQYSSLTELLNASR